MQYEVSQLPTSLASRASFRPQSTGRAELHCWGASLWSVRVGASSYGVARWPGRARVVGGPGRRPALLLDRRVRETDDVLDILRVALLTTGAAA